MTDLPETCDCPLCAQSPGHPAKRFHDAFRRIAHCLPPDELAVCLAQYGAKSEMGDRTDAILCQIGGLTSDRLSDARNAAARDQAALMESLRRAPEAIRAIAADGETETWLGEIAAAAGGGAGGGAGGDTGFQLHPTTLFVQLNDWRYRLDMPADWMAYANLFEVLLRANYDHARKPVDTVYDLGGYIGLSALYLHSCYPDAEIVAVEPDPANLRYLLANLGGSGQPIRHRIVDRVVAAATGTVALASLTDSPDATSMVHSTVIEHASASTRSAAAVGLSDLVTAGRPYGIKLDIEGGEFGLEPARRVLSDASWILGEFHYGPWTRPADRWLRDLLETEFDLALSPPRLEMTGSGDYFCIGQDFRAMR